MKVAVVTFVWRDYGGWPTYMKHLSRGLEAIGVEHRIVTNIHPEGNKQAQVPRVEWRKTLDFAEPEYMDEADIIYVACIRPGEGAWARRVKAAGKPTVVLLHDPSEWRTRQRKPGVLNTIRFMEPAWVEFIGEYPMSTLILGEPDFPIPLRWHKHPYQRIGEGAEPGERAVCTARIDWDKRTHYVLAADCGVELWTGYIDPRYNWQHWKGKVREHPDYKGKFGVTDLDIAAVYDGACALVDMSTISGDGGRTQYTFLEAMDFGLGLVLATDWHKDGGELQRDVHFLPASNPDDIRTHVTYLREHGNPHGEAHAAVLEAHDAALIARELEGRWKELL